MENIRQKGGLQSMPVWVNQTEGLLAFDRHAALQRKSFELLRNFVLFPNFGDLRVFKLLPFTHLLLQLRDRLELRKQCILARKRI